MAMVMMDFRKVDDLIRHITITKSEIEDITVKIYEEMIKMKEFENAYKIALEYDLDDEKVAFSALHLFKDFIANGKFEEAIDWAKKSQKIKEAEINKSIIEGFDYYLKKK